VQVLAFSFGDLAIGLGVGFSDLHTRLLLVEAMGFLGVQLPRRDALLDALFLVCFTLVDTWGCGCGGRCGGCLSKRADRGDGERGTDERGLEVQHDRSLV